jgi:membrane-associated HD superfamily phosphohydrolase
MELNDLDFKIAAKNYDKFLDKRLDSVDVNDNYLNYCIGRLAIEAGKAVPYWVYSNTTNKRLKLDLYIRTMSEEEINTKLPEHSFDLGKFDVLDIVKLLIEKGYEMPEKFLKHMEDLDTYYKDSDIYYTVVKALLFKYNIPFNKIQTVLLDKIEDINISEILSNLLIAHRKKEITHKGWEILNNTGLINKAIKLKIINPEDVPSDIEIKILNDSFGFKNYFNRQIL